MKRVLIKYYDGSIPIVHFDDVFGNGYTLCGHDTDGDSRLGWNRAVETTKRVTCERCQRIVKECKQINDNEISKISRR